jgi:hypothetical protein
MIVMQKSVIWQAKLWFWLANCELDEQDVILIHKRVILALTNQQISTNDWKINPYWILTSGFTTRITHHECDIDTLSEI